MIMARQIQKDNIIPLFSASAGQLLKIYSLPDGPIHAQFIRIGIHKGERIRCLERLPGGTIVLQKNRQQIALGHKLAKQIFVIVLDGREHR